jgi:hypothetical protein
MSATLMGHSIEVAALLRRVLRGVEAFIDHDPGLVEEHRAEDVGVEAGPRHTEQAVGVVELDAELEVLLDDIFDGDRRGDGNASRLRLFGQQRRRVALDLFFGEVRHEPGHLSWTPKTRQLVKVEPCP